MKKILCIFLLMCSLFSLVGCYKPLYKDPDVGTYFSKKIESESSEFTSCRMEIKKIIEAQFDRAEGINVCKPNSSIASYFRFEIYLFSTITNQEELVSLSDICYDSNTFYGNASLKILDKEYSSNFDLDYQNRTTSICFFNYNIDFYLYRNDLMQGELIPLNDAYQNGFITHQDLQQISYQYNQINYQGEVDYGNDFKPKEYLFSTINEVICNSIEVAYDKKYNPFRPFVVNPQHYGIYGKCYVFSIDFSNETGGCWKTIMDGVTFYNYDELYIWSPDASKK